MAFRAEYLPLVLPIPSIWMHDGWIAILISASSNMICINSSLILYRQHSNQQLGAPKRSIGAHIASALQSDSYKNYKLMPEQYQLVYDRIQEKLGSRITQRRLCLLQNKIRHMQFRAELPKIRVRRIPVITNEILLNRYKEYGYGWRDVIRDLIANLGT